ncbi:MAG: dihydroorotate dehydrogenase [Candidatus Woesearchaeota archaeon]
MIECKFLNIEFRNPIILASGILGKSSEYFTTLEKYGIGGITTKSISSKPRSGHNNPIMFCDEHGFMNAVGLSNAGVEESIKMIRQAKKMIDIPIIASIFGGNTEEFGEIAELVSEARPDIIEINISCPNVKKEFRIFAADEKSAADVTSIVKDNLSHVKIPVTVKLSPNVTNIVPVAKAVQEAGADAITAINTIGGMRINIDARMPILTNKFGGVSGKGIFPVAVKNVYEIYKAVDIPIIGTGGITTGKDGIEMMMAGASLLGVGSAVYYRGEKVFGMIAEEMEKWLSDNGYSGLKELIGAAHD